MQAAALRRIAESSGHDELLQAAESPDPFVRQAAREGVTQSFSVGELIALSRSDVPAQRLAALLALRDLDTEPARRALPAGLKDPDPAIRLASVQWVYESGLDAFRADLESGMTAGVVTDRLFRAYLAALTRLDQGAAPLQNEVPDRAYVARLAFDTKTPPALRRLALRYLAPDDPALSADRLDDLLNSSDPGLRLEAVRKLCDRPGADQLPRLAALAREVANPESLRAEAIAGLAEGAESYRGLLLDLAASPSESIRQQAVRSLRGLDLEPEQRKGIEAVKLSPLLDPEAGSWESSLLDDPARLATPGNPAEGERVFFIPAALAVTVAIRLMVAGPRSGPT